HLWLISLTFHFLFFGKHPDQLAGDQSMNSGVVWPADADLRQVVPNGFHVGDDRLLELFLKFLHRLVENRNEDVRLLFIHLNDDLLVADGDAQLARAHFAPELEEPRRLAPIIQVFEKRMLKRISLGRDRYLLFGRPELHPCFFAVLIKHLDPPNASSRSM